MTRKNLLAAALAIAALAGSFGIGTAQANWHGRPGWVYYHGWGPRYYAYHYVPYYVGPRCYPTIYGTTYCD